MNNTEFMNHPTQPPSEREARGIRRAGWFAAAIGAMLIAGLTISMIRFGPDLIRTATNREREAYGQLFALFILFGLTVLISGAAMIRTGRRSKWTIFPILGIVGAIGIVGANLAQH